MICILCTTSPWLQRCSPFLSKPRFGIEDVCRARQSAQKEVGRQKRANSDAAFHMLQSVLREILPYFMARCISHTRWTAGHDLNRRRDCRAYGNMASAFQFLYEAGMNEESSLHTVVPAQSSEAFAWRQWPLGSAFATSVR